jgi:hypothetical protein
VAVVEHGVTRVGLRRYVAFVVQGVAESGTLGVEEDDVAEGLRLVLHDLALRNCGAIDVWAQLVAVLDVRCRSATVRDPTAAAVCLDDGRPHGLQVGRFLARRRGQLAVHQGLVLPPTRRTGPTNPVESVGLRHVGVGLPPST